ncbi:MAG: hypothetical protein HKN47_02505 [Pirellulaceae bacterium]|nr:hypothetical protein [Pirellulaceae bacterium]
MTRKVRLAAIRRRLVGGLPKMGDATLSYAVDGSLAQANRTGSVKTAVMRRGNQR